MIEGRFVLASVAVLTVGAVLIFGDASKAGAWLDVLEHLAVALPGLVAIFQNRRTSQRLEEVREHVRVNGSKGANGTIGLPPE